MDDMFWLRDGLIAGSAGPDRVVWNIQELAKNNIGRVLSVNDGELIRKEELQAVSIDYKCIPLSKSAPPITGDLELCLEVLPKALEFVLDSRVTNAAALVHCSSGKDRTGMFLCYYLCIVENYFPEEAVAEVKRVRSIALSAPGWEELTYAVLRRAVT